MRRMLLAAAIILATGAVGHTATSGDTQTSQIMIRPGTILPVQLNNSISSKKAKPGQIVTARIMQSVPLPRWQKIRAGSKVIGHIVSTERATGSAGGRVTVRFDSVVIEGKTVSIRTNLRAIAGPLEVEDAQVPEWGADRGTSLAAYTTVQIGGEVVYRGGGHVQDGNVRVGVPVAGGVLARVSADPQGRCRDGVAGNDAPQALWVFSSTACGVYGISRLEIVQAGRDEPEGKIVLASTSGDVNVRSGSGMLLRVDSAGE